MDATPSPPPPPPPLPEAIPTLLPAQNLKRKRQGESVDGEEENTRRINAEQPRKSKTQAVGIVIVPPLL